VVRPRITPRNCDDDRKGERREITLVLHQPIQKEQQRVDLIVVPSWRESQQLALKVSKPTASTSFANPAVTIARSFSNTFAGIAPSGVLAFIGVQLVGMLAAVAVGSWLWPERSPRDRIRTVKALGATIRASDPASVWFRVSLRGDRRSSGARGAAGFSARI
jgi:hypothetical protein